MKAIIIGAGIGGLATAIALRLKGWEVTLFEQARALGEIGAGLQISPNGYKILTALGVNPKNAVEPNKIEMRMGASGREVFSLPIKTIANARWGAPYIHIHRKDLHDALFKRLEELGGFDLILDHHIERFEETKNQLHIGKHSGDILIGADGVHSKTRNIISGEDQTRFTGNVAWRALVPLAKLDNPPPKSAIIWAGKKQHAISTHISNGTLVNFVGITEEANWQEEGWNIDVDPALAREQFAGWHPMIEEILANAERVNRWALLSRPPLANWYKSRAVLVGDAAHPMLPSFAQGAVQALEDAYILAECLGESGDHSQAFAQYQNLRSKRAAHVQKASLNNLQIYHRSGIYRSLSYGAAWMAGKIMPEILYRRLDWLYGYDAMQE